MGQGQTHRVSLTGLTGEGRWRLPPTDHSCRKGEDGPGPDAEKCGFTRPCFMAYWGMFITNQYAYLCGKGFLAEQEATDASSKRRNLWFNVLPQREGYLGVSCCFL